MLEPLLLRPDLGLQVLALEPAPSAFIIHLAATAPTALCPLCQQPATRVHSHYSRTLRDLPCSDYPLRLQVRSRRFRCRTIGCPQWIFCERLPTLARPWAQLTTRAAIALRQVGLALGGAAGARLLLSLHLPTSPDTLLRLVRQAVPAPALTPRVLGVDDFALRKGQTYGTILVDLETSTPIDLLPDREASTFAAWLREHPGIEIISRDRAGAYAEGARLGAPQAQQVADRWHILKNLGDALEELLVRLYPELVTAHQAAPSPPTGPAALALPASAAEEIPAPAPPPSPQQEPTGSGPPSSRTAASAPAVPRRVRDTRRSQAHRRNRHDRYEEVRRLHAAGWTLSAIARQLGLDRGTVSAWVQNPAFPERQPRSPQPQRLDPYKAYLGERWAAGARNARQLWHEIQARGYRGGYSRVAEYLAGWRPAAPAGAGARNGPDLPRPRPLRWVLWKAAATRTREEAQIVAMLEEQHAGLRVAAGLVAEFQRLLQQRQPQDLAGWVQAALASGIAELGSFARGVQRDFAAVYAGVAGKYSNGPVEGQVNRLKMLKRQLYGRAKFDLLRLRVLYAH